MHVTARVDYSLRALIELASSGTETVLTADHLGKLHDIPTGFLLAILADLRRAGLLSSVRGSAGGWKLAKRPEEITVADIIRVVDGPLVSVVGTSPESMNYAETAKSLQPLWVAARSALRNVFEKVTIQDLCLGNLPVFVVDLTTSEEDWTRRRPPGEH